MKKLLYLSPILAVTLLSSGCYYTEPAVVVRPAHPAVVVRPARPAVVVRPGPVVVRPRRVYY